MSTGVILTCHAHSPTQSKKVRDRAAVVDLFNSLVWMEDPTALTADDVKAMGDK